MFVGEDLLPGTAKADEHDAGPTPVDPFDRRRSSWTLKGRNTEGSAPTTCSAGKRAIRAPRSLAYGLRGRAVKVDGDGALGSALAQPDGELRAVDALAQPRSIKEVKGVANRLAVRCDNVKILDSSAKCRVLRRGHHTVDRERRYQSRGAISPAAMALATTSS